MTEITNHPLIFTLRETVSGNGFLAGITLSGRALMVKEDDGKWWMYGVRPGAIAESGDTPQEAFARFRNRYKETLFDIAEENRSFADFRTEIERFFYEADEEEEHRWEEALRIVRAAASPLPEPFCGLPRETPETRPSQITVEKLSGEGRRFMPSDNVQDCLYKAA